MIVSSALGVYESETSHGSWPLGRPYPWENLTVGVGGPVLHDRPGSRKSYSDR